MKYERHFEIERADVELETGTIKNLAVFTGGEASDGHILNIAGAKLPKDVPFFVQHEADPRTQLGTLTNPRREEDAVVFDGHVLVEGDGSEAEVRRDLLLKIARGHVKRLSGRWDADDGDVKRRINLPSDHPAFVDEKKSNSVNRFGFFFDKWTPMEGSVVGLGADPAAVMRWAEDSEATDAVRAFWRGEIQTVDLSVYLDALREKAEIALYQGADQAQLINAVVASDGKLPDLEAYEHEGIRLLLPPSLIESIKERDDNEETEESETVVVNRDHLELLQERLDALEALERKPSLPQGDEKERVPAEPLSAPERVDAAPLAATSPKLQALMMREQRGKPMTALDLSSLLREVLGAERENVHRLRDEAIAHRRGRVK